MAKRKVTIEIAMKMDETIALMDETKAILVEMKAIFKSKAMPFGPAERRALKCFPTTFFKAFGA